MNKIPDPDFEAVLSELDALAKELSPRYTRYDSLDQLLASRSKNFKLPVEVTEKSS